MPVEPRQFDPRRLVESLPIDAVVRDPLDHDEIGGHAAGHESVVNPADGLVVAELLLLGDDEERWHRELVRRLHGAESDVFRRIGPHLDVPLHRAAQAAGFDRHRLGLAAGLRAVQVEHPLLGRGRPRPPEPRHLGNHALHPRVMGPDPGHEPASVARAHDPDSLRVDVGLAGEKADRRPDVFRLVRVVHLPAQRADLDRDLVPVRRCGLRVNRHELALALAPAAVVEGQGCVTAGGDDRPESAAGSFLRAAGTGAEDDPRQLLTRRAVARQVEIPRHPRAVAPDRDRPRFDVGCHIRVGGDDHLDRQAYDGQPGDGAHHGRTVSDHRRSPPG